MKTVVIAGPTASGKSEFAVNLALKINGEIISADSMQIYRGMNIGTAKITSEETKGVKHRLIDVAEPNEEFTVADFKENALAAEAEIRAAGKIPIVVGGSGLYINALIYDYNFRDVSPNPQLRERYQTFYNENGAEALYSLLREKSSSLAAEIHPNNIKRVIRALETCDSDDARQPVKNLRSDVVTVILNRDRKILYDKINARVDNMFENGLLDEVNLLLEHGYGFEQQSMQAIGYKEFKGYFQGEYDLEMVTYLIKLNSRHYAKRQICWFKGVEAARWFDACSEKSECEKYITENLELSGNGF